MTREIGSGLGAALLLATLATCGRGEIDLGTVAAAEQRDAIVGGQRETGWPAVGALYMRHRYDDSQTTFCTGTLVAPRWVLTAAHCLVGVSYAPVPAMVKFFMGDDALPADGSLDPAQGSLVATQALHVHPAYDPEGNFDHDIGLVQLAEAVTEIEALTLRQQHLGFSDIGTTARYVGFGVDDGVAGTGAGIKRSTEASISWVGLQHYRAFYPQAGTCYGDSGGPGLLASDDGTEVIGVNVAHFSDVPCEDGYALKTRVALHADWLQTTMQSSPDCRDNTLLCLCDGACQEDGSCVDSQCETLACVEALACEAACVDDECSARCALSVRPAQQPVWEAYVACRQAACDRELWGSTLLECAADACADLLHSCETAEDDLCDSDGANCPVEDGDGGVGEDTSSDAGEQEPDAAEQEPDAANAPTSSPDAGMAPLPADSGPGDDLARVDGGAGDLAEASGDRDEVDTAEELEEPLSCASFGTGPMPTWLVTVLLFLGLRRRGRHRHASRLKFALAHRQQQPVICVRRPPLKLSANRKQKSPFVFFRTRTHHRKDIGFWL